MCHAVDEYDEQDLDGISDDEAVPKQGWGFMRDKPEDGDDRQ